MAGNVTEAEFDALCAQRDRAKLLVARVRSELALAEKQYAHFDGLVRSAINATAEPMADKPKPPELVEKNHA